MNIQDIIDQEKQKELIKKSNLKQQKHLKKLFYKDCYKMWKDYKKVEKPYTWWLELFSLFNLISCLNYAYWVVLYAPKEYVTDSWFDKKWQIDKQDNFSKINPKLKIKHKTNPNNDYINLYEYS